MVLNSNDPKKMANGIVPANGLLDHKGNMDELVSARERSKQIDRYLSSEDNKYKKYMRKTMRLLLVGAGESGKSTIVKQMKILHKGGYTDEERREFIPVIRTNIRESIVTLIHAIQTLSTVPIDRKPVFYSDIEYVRTQATSSNFKIDNKFFDVVERLWDEEVVQNIYLRENEYQLIDSAKYFLDKIDDIRKDDFLPCDTDIVRSRQKTVGVLETQFEVKGIQFHMLDVGGQRDERRKWIQCFSDVTALIFVVACSGFDTVLREDETQNRLQESLDIYTSLWGNRFLKDTSVIVFLNKQDILKDKVASGRTNFEQFFPEYKDYEATHPVERIEPTCCCFVSKRRIQLQERRESQFPGLSPAASRELYRAQTFIRDKFEEISKTSGSAKFRKCCYPHFTIAIDTENIQKVFSDCRDMIIRENLRKYELL